MKHFLAALLLIGLFFVAPSRASAATCATDFVYFSARDVCVSQKLYTDCERFGGAIEVPSLQGIARDACIGQLIDLNGKGTALICEGIATAIAAEQILQGQTPNYSGMVSACMVAIIDSPDYVIQAPIGVPDNTQAYNLCSHILDGGESSQCSACVSHNAGVWTAFGCIRTDPREFVVNLIKLALSVGGGVALLLMLYGAFHIITAAGNPDQIKGGQETISAALMGLIFIIFAVAIIQFVGITILNLPGLTP